MFVGIDVWHQCPGVVPWTSDVTLLLILMALGGTIAGFGITHFVQNTFPLHVRMELLVLSHSIGFLAWTLPCAFCSRWTFLILVLQMYNWGSEPYDNVFSGRLWSSAYVRWKQ